MSAPSSSSSSVPTEQDTGGPSKPKSVSACDTCRRRKLKCSASQPCDRCIASGVNCTYGFGASRTSSIAYARHLEAKIAELQALLRLQPSAGSGDQPQPSHNPIATLVSDEDDFVYSSTDSDLETYHGSHGALSLLRLVRELCDHTAGGSKNDHGRVIAAAFDSNLLNVPLTNQIAYLALLPPREKLDELVVVALDDALSCQEFVDRPKLYSQIDRLYETDPESHTASDRRALSLIYALLALGRQCSIDATPLNDNPRAVFMPGLSYFHASRAIIDAVDNNDLDSIRAIICLANYLMSASMASKAYGGISIAVAAAIRMGLHVYSPAMRERFSADELTQRRKVFAVLHFTQCYLASMLGMPMLLQNADPEQLIPVPEDGLDDEGRSFVLQQPTTATAATILLCKLGRVLGEVVQSHFQAYRSTSRRRPSASSNSDEIERWERELSAWNAELPPIAPDAVDRTVLRAQLMLRFVDAAVRVAIYRPFIHHVVRNVQDSEFSPKGFEYGSACLKASMQAIWLADTMDSHDILIPGKWYVVYNLAIGACSLTLFALCSGESPTVPEVQAAAEKAKQLLEKLSQTRMSARNCLESLNALHRKTSEPHDQTISPRTQFMQAIGAMEF